MSWIEISGVLAIRDELRGCRIVLSAALNIADYLDYYDGYPCDRYRDMDIPITIDQARELRNVLNRLILASESGGD